MHLLLYSHEGPPGFGGVQTHLASLAQGAAELEHQVTMVCNDIADAHGYDSKVPFRVLRMSPKEAQDPGYIMKLIAKFHPDKVHAVDWQGQMTLAGCPANLLPPTMATLYGTEIFLLNHPDQRLRALGLYQAAEKVVVISRYTHELVCRHFPEIKSKLCIIPPAYDSTRFSRIPEPAQIISMRKELEVGDDPTVLTLARLIPRKGIDRVLEALPLILGTLPQVKYVIAGDGPDRERLKNIAARVGVEHALRFVGNVSQTRLLSAYDLCDLFVMPARQDGLSVEGFGLAYIEAGSRGKPVIGSTHGGIPDAVLHERTGLLVPEEDKPQLAGAIIRLLTNQEEARRFGSAGRCRAQGELSQTSIARMNYG